MSVSRKRKEHKNRGVTLFEVMIAIALFAIIVTPVMKSFVTAIKVNQKSRKVMIATDLAQSLMEGYMGKSYEDVWNGMERSVSPFVFDGTDNVTARLAFSSVNEGYFNHGHSKPLGTAGFGTSATDVIKSVTNEGYELNVSGVNAMAPGETDINKLISIPAIKALEGRIETNGLVGAFADTAASGAAPYENTDGTPVASDKLIYYGRSVEEYASATAGTAGIPKMCYMVYFRIQKDGNFYDAVVSFVPNAQNEGADAKGNAWLKPGTTEKMDDDYFSYKIRITVYEYKYEGADPVTGVGYGYDASTKTWPSRYINHMFEGEPVAIMESGIQYKR